MPWNRIVETGGVRLDPARTKRGAGSIYVTAVDRETLNALGAGPLALVDRSLARLRSSPSGTRSPPGTGGLALAGFSETAVGSFSPEDL